MNAENVSGPGGTKQLAQLCGRRPLRAAILDGAAQRRAPTPSHLCTDGSIWLRPGCGLSRTHKRSVAFPLCIRPPPIFISQNSLYRTSHRSIACRSRRTLLSRNPIDWLSPRSVGRACQEPTARRPIRRSTCSTSRPARDAFDLRSGAARCAPISYGRSQFGQSVLLSRRLIEAGVRLVQVNWFRSPDEPTDAPCWDSHVREADRLKTVLLPPFDQAYSPTAPHQNLVERGMLDETLIVWHVGIRTRLEDQRQSVGATIGVAFLYL